ncbi:MAG TPA: hypothetical protein VFC63_02690 [Blastocatellia bacterium]|nr:hypothetical protein [Blastocatellia bacterium]
MALPVLECLKLGMRAHKVFRERILATFPPGFSEVESKVRLCETLYGDEVDIKGFEESLRKAAERDARKETQSR